MCVRNKTVNCRDLNRTQARFQNCRSPDSNFLSSPEGFSVVSEHFCSTFEAFTIRIITVSREDSVLLLLHTMLNASSCRDFWLFHTKLENKPINQTFFTVINTKLANLTIVDVCAPLLLSLSEKHTFFHTRLTDLYDFRIGAVQTDGVNFKLWINISEYCHDYETISLF